MEWIKYNKADYSMLDEGKAYLIYDKETDNMEMVTGYIYEDIDETGWCWWAKDMDGDDATHYLRVELPKT